MMTNENLAEAVIECAAIRGIHLEIDAARDKLVVCYYPGFDDLATDWYGDNPIARAVNKPFFDGLIKTCERNITAVLRRRLRPARAGNSFISRIANYMGRDNGS